MERRDAALFALELLQRNGAEKAQVVASSSEKQELNLAAGSISLLRTTMDSSLSLTAIREGRKGSLGINKFEKEDISRAVEQVMQVMEAGAPDPAYDIAPKIGGARTFENGPQEANLNEMYEGLDLLASTVKKKFSKVAFEESYHDFRSGKTTFLNSNGVDFESQQGYYSLFAMFTGKDGKKTSSFNYTGGSFTERPKQPFLSLFGLEGLLQESIEHLEAKPLGKKLEGELILTPHSAGPMLGSLFSFLSDGPMIAGTSVFRDKLNQQIASSSLTVRAEPLGAQFAAKEFYNGEGFLSETMPILERGVLKTFLLSQYGANKTGKSRAKSSGHGLIVEPGNLPFREILKKVNNGILLGRFSGSRPTQSGEFSGVAKNSYFIENGRISHPVSETMISGNVFELFKNVLDISSERMNDGSQELPWIRMGNVTISGK